jgi:hypothetical protein
MPDFDSYGELVGHTHQGFPIYRYPWPRSSAERFVVILPGDRPYFCDSKGRLAPSFIYELPTVAAMMLGLTGLLVWGAVAGMVGAGIGALIGQELSRRRLQAHQ